MAFFDLWEWLKKTTDEVGSQRDGNNGISSTRSDLYGEDMEVANQKAITEKMIQVGQNIEQQMEHVPAASTYSNGNQGIPPSTGENSTYSKNPEKESQKRISEEVPNWGRSYEALPNSFNQQGTSYYSEKDWEQLIQNTQGEIGMIQGRIPTREETIAYLREHNIYPDARSFPEGRWIRANDYPAQFNISEIPQQSVGIEKYVRKPLVYDGILDKNIVYRGVQTPEEVEAREERRRKAMGASYVEALSGGLANFAGGTMQGAGLFAQDFADSKIRDEKQKLIDQGYSKEQIDPSGLLENENPKVNHNALYNLGTYIKKKYDDKEYEFVSGEEVKSLLYALGKHGPEKILGQKFPKSSRLLSLLQQRQKVEESLTMSEEEKAKALKQIDERIEIESSYQPELY